jgi:hypothetical protein
MPGSIVSTPARMAIPVPGDAFGVRRDAVAQAVALLDRGRHLGWRVLCRVRIRARRLTISNPRRAGRYRLEARHIGARRRNVC